MAHHHPGPKARRTKTPGRPRRTRTPRPAAVNTMQMAATRAARLSAADVHLQMAIIRRALAEFSTGQRCLDHWRSLADTANMAETLAGMGLGSGPEADRAIHAAQAALHQVHQRHTQRGTWALRAAELEALHWLVQLHEVQLTACSYGELDAALRRTAHRIAQARSGNASRDAIVVVGDMATVEAGGACVA